MDQHEQLTSTAAADAAAADARLRSGDDDASADGSFALLADDAPLQQATAGDAPLQQATAGDAPPAADAQAATTPTADGATHFATYEPELLQWMQSCQAADHGLPPSQDDVFAFLESKFPELLERAAALFAWLSRFLRAYNQEHAPSVLLEADATGVQQFDRFSDDFKLSALQRLATTGNPSDVARDFELKSTATLAYWKHQRDAAGQQLQQAAVTRGQPLGGEHARKVGFAHEQELLEWVMARRGSPITKHDVFTHVVATYPDYTATRTPAALKMWIARFLKRRVSSPRVASSRNVRTALPVTGVVEAVAGEGGGGGAEPSPSTGFALDTADTTMPPAARTPAAKLRPVPPPPTSSTSAPMQPKRRAKRGCPDGYVLHSNEFKLNALRKLDEGKTMSEVTEELGLKSQNTLAYWNSIRDKLATSEKKRFRLAGGGRRSSCTFEDELLSWVAERHHKGEGTDVAAVLGYLREVHPAFTEGKKEPTLRKWILRFFKRCWKTPTVASGSTSNGDKSSIFV